MRMAQQRDRNEDQVEHGGDERDALPRPVAVGHERDEQDDPRAQHGKDGPHAEESQAGANGDELRYEREKVSDHQIDHREPSPEGAEAIEDEFGVTAVSGGAEAHGHFLDNAGHNKSEDDEWQEEADAETGSGGGIGQHAGAIVFAEHDEDTRTDEQPEQPGAGPEAATGTGFANALAVVRAVDVFMGDDNTVGVGLGGARRHSPWRRRQCLRVGHSDTDRNEKAEPTELSKRIVRIRTSSERSR